MLFGRLIGWLFVVGAIVAAGFEVSAVIDGRPWQPIALGELWYRIHAGSLNAAQAGIQRHIAPWLWEPVITTILLWPVWFGFGGPGILLVWACRRRGHNLFRNRH